MRPGPALDKIIGKRIMRLTEEQMYTVPAYSTTLLAAWRVVEKLNSEGGCFSLINDDFGHWALVSDGFQPAKKKFTGATTFFVRSEDWADDPAYAICIAALKTAKRQ